MRSSQMRRVDSVAQGGPSGAKAAAADQAPAAQHQAANAPIATSGGRKFSDMPLRERLDILDQIKATES